MNNSINERIIILNKNELVSKLIALDDEVSMVLPNDERINMTIVGGGALNLQGYREYVEECKK